MRDTLKNVGNGHQSEHCEDPCVLKNEFFLFKMSLNSQGKTMLHNMPYNYTKELKQVSTKRFELKVFAMVLHNNGGR